MTVKTRSQLATEFTAIKNEVAIGPHNNVSKSNTYQNLLDSVVVPGEETLNVNGVRVSSIRMNAPGDLGLLLSELNSAAGTIIQDIFVGDTIPSSYTLCDEWPSAMPGTTPLVLTPAGAAAHFPIVRDSVSGKKGIGDSIGNLDRALVSTNYTPEAVIIVYRSLGGTNSLNIPIAITGSVYPFMNSAYVTTFDESSASGNPIHYRDGYYLGALQTPELSVFCGTCINNSIASLKVGGFNGFSMSMKGEIYSVIPLSDAPNETQLNAINAAFVKYYKTQRKRLLILDGHSISAGYYAGLPSQAGGQFDYWSCLDIPGTVIRNISINGRTPTTTLAALTASLAGIDTRGFRDIVYLLDDDINAYIAGDSAAAVVAANWAITDAVKTALPGAKCIVCSCMPSVGALDSTKEARRVSGNALKLSQYTSHVEGYLDLASVPGFNDSTSSLFVADHLHHSIPGIRYYATLKRNAVVALP